MLGLGDAIPTTHIYKFELENQSTKMVNNSFVVLEIVQELKAGSSVKVLFILTAKMDKEHAGLYCHPVEIHLSRLSQQPSTSCSREHFRQAGDTNPALAP